MSHRGNPAPSPQHRAGMPLGGRESTKTNCGPGKRQPRPATAALEGRQRHRKSLNTSGIRPRPSYANGTTIPQARRPLLCLPQTRQFLSHQGIPREIGAPEHAETPRRVRTLRRKWLSKRHHQRGNRPNSDRYKDHFISAQAMMPIWTGTAAANMPQPIEYRLPLNLFNRKEGSGDRPQFMRRNKIISLLRNKHFMHSTNSHEIESIQLIAADCWPNRVII